MNARIFTWESVLLPLRDKGDLVITSFYLLSGSPSKEAGSFIHQQRLTAAP